MRTSAGELTFDWHPLAVSAAQGGGEAGAR